MAEITFSPVARRDIFEVHDKGAPVGMVWDGDGCWHAARFSKANPTITQPDRLAAAEALIGLR